MRSRLPADLQQALCECEAIIRSGSRSFSLAARLLEPVTREAVYGLYGWCRYCDDRIDKPSLTHSLASDVAKLKALTRSAFAGSPQDHGVFIALQYVARSYSIPEHYALELLEGMAMDARGQRYRSFSDLLVYCYRVAGTVGLMMAHIMGISSEKALRSAADLGIAMQLTNIARDIIEDANHDRIYLPLSWLEQAHIAPEEIAAPRHRPKLVFLAEKILSNAYTYYRSGDEGLNFLSFRSACAVSAARYVYSDIGRLLHRRREKAWDTRTYSGTFRKITWAGAGVLRVCCSVPRRAVRPWVQSTIQTVVNHSELS